MIAVVGAGAIGGVVAAQLCALDRHEVALCVRSPFERLVVDGPTRSRTFNPTIWTTPFAARPVEWVFIACKAHQSSGIADWLATLAGPATTIAILQNGVEHRERIAPIAPSARLLPVIVDCPALRLAPGHVVQRGALALTVEEGEAGRAFAALFSESDATVTVTQDFVTAAWRKLCFNVAGGAITALTDRTLEVIHEPNIEALARGLITECLQVGRAQGAQLDDALVEQLLDAARRAPAGAVNSMLADRRAGRPLEADARNGAVVRFGARNSIATPLNHAVNALLLAINAAPGASRA